MKKLLPYPKKVENIIAHKPCEHIKWMLTEAVQKLFSFIWCKTTLYSNITLKPNGYMYNRIANETFKESD